MAAISENKLWHDTVTTWPDRNAFLFGKDFMSDCSFLIEDEENDEKVKIPGHKYILGGVCLDFYNLFYLMEANTNEIPITDVSVKDFKVFLKYIYIGETDLTMDNIRDVLKLVERFSIKCFKDYCENFLTKQLKKSNYLKIMDTISSYEMENLNSKCMTFLSSRDLLELPEFLDIKSETLSMILTSNKSTIKEIDIFQCAIKWAVRNCEKNGIIPNSKNKREALGASLMDIRFASMTNEEFTECTNDDTILTNLEVIQVFRFIGSGGKSECKFSSDKRIPFITTKLSIVNRNLSSIYRSGLRQDSLSFKINKSLKIGGFGLQKNSSKSSELSEKVIIKLFDCNNTVLLENDTEIIVTKDSKTHDLLFKDTFTLEADTEYVLEYSFPEVAKNFFDDSLIFQAHTKVLFDDSLRFENTFTYSSYCAIVYIGIVE